jgi:hypothetical protein
MGYSLIFLRPISMTDTAIRAAASGVNSDIRHLASSAKTLYELEGVLASPALLEVENRIIEIPCIVKLMNNHQNDVSKVN